MLSDRKATVNYAIDLLRAHQIRRENLFLHEELQRCCKEIAVLRQEVKDGQADAQASNEAYQKTHRTVEEQNTRLNSQGQSLEDIQRSYSTMQREISDLRTRLDQSIEYNQARCERLSKDIGNVMAGWQKVVQGQEEAAASLEALRNTVDGKADNSVVQALMVQVNGLSIPPLAGEAERSLPSVSRVHDSFERGPAPSNIPGNRIYQEGWPE
jgi:chromosome segregation ATPase